MPAETSGGDAEKINKYFSVVPRSRSSAPGTVVCYWETSHLCTGWLHEIPASGHGFPSPQAAWLVLLCSLLEVGIVRAPACSHGSESPWGSQTAPSHGLVADGRSSNVLCLRPVLAACVRAPHCLCLPWFLPAVVVTYYQGRAPWRDLLAPAQTKVSVCMLLVYLDLAQPSLDTLQATEKDQSSPWTTKTLLAVLVWLAIVALVFDNFRQMQKGT